jgi:endonuclease YncB( thermonuclease family)
MLNIRGIKMIKKITLPGMIPALVVYLMLLHGIAHAGQFRVMRVYDGDTLRAKGYDIEIKVNLIGIDAPEISIKKNVSGQPYGQQAKKFLASMVLDKKVIIKGYGSDRYNRVLGVVYIDGKNVNLEILKAGLAEFDRSNRPKIFDPMPYQLAATAAKKAGAGMWSLGDRYMSPREWRRMQQKQ